MGENNIIRFKEEFMREAEERAYLYSKNKVSGNCGQSVLLPLQELLRLDSESTYNAATLLGGGVCNTGHTCTALIAGVMVLGMWYCDVKPDKERNLIPLKAAGVKLVRWFEQEYGTTSCRQITGYDLTDEKGLAEYLESEVSEACRRMCGAIAAKVAEVVTELG